MKTRHILAATFALSLAACTSGPATPQWQMEAASASERFVSAYLGGSRAADAEWSRTYQALASTAQPQQVARAHLLRCAVQVASLDWGPRCEGFEALRTAAAPQDVAYADYLQGRWSAGQLAQLPDVQRGIAARGWKHLASVQDPLSRLLGAAVWLRSGQVPPAEQGDLVALAVDTASLQGWRRPLMAWLQLQLKQAQAQGRMQDVQRIEQRLAVLQAQP